jgi:threonyl-tRNA synthetase
MRNIFGEKILDKLYLNSYFTELDLQEADKLTPYKAEPASTKDYKNMSIAEVSSVFEKYKTKLIDNKIGNPLDLLSHFRNSAFTNEDIEEFLELCK